MKKKNLLMGLTIGALMATTPLVTACKSDITFNQDDLNTAISNINEYLETQNNYNSEFAKNVLNDYLLKGIERNLNNAQFGYRITYETQNSYKDIYEDYSIDYKLYKTNNTIKELCNTNGDDVLNLKGNTNNYREITSEYKTLSSDPGSGGTLSEGKTYYYSGTIFCEDLTKTTGKYSKTTFTDKTKGDLDDWTPFGSISNIYSDLMLAITAPEASYYSPGDYFTNQTDVVMGQDGEFETFAFTNVFNEFEDGEFMSLSINCKFKDGILHSVKFISNIKDNYYTETETNQVITIELTEHIDDFNIDKTPYQA